MAEANVDIKFNADLTGPKAEFDAFLEYVQQHQPTINGKPIADAMTPDAQRTATTFGGLQSIAASDPRQYVPSFMLQQFPAAAPNAQQPDHSTPIGSAPRPFPGAGLVDAIRNTDTPAPAGSRTPSFRRPTGDVFAGEPLGISGMVRGGEGGAGELAATPGLVEAMVRLTAALERQAQGAGGTSRGTGGGSTANQPGRPVDPYSPSNERQFERQLLRRQLIEAPTVDDKIKLLQEQIATPGTLPHERERWLGDIAQLEQRRQREQERGPRAGRGPITDYGRNYGPRLPDGGFRSTVPQIEGFGRETNAYLSSGEATAEHQDFARRMLEQRLSGGGAEAAGPSFSRAGLRRFLGQEGLRGLGRYFGVYGVAQVATSYLNQQNRFAIDSANARDPSDIIQAQIAYQQNSPLAAVPFAGQLGLGIREYATGDQAYLGSLGASARFGEETYGIRQGILARRLTTSADVAAAGGDFSGQIEAAGLRSQATTAQYRGTRTGELTRLGQLRAAADDEITRFQDDHRTPEGRLDLGEVQRQQLSGMQSKRDALVAQINTIAKDIQDFVDSQAKELTATSAAVSRARSSFLVGSESRIRATSLRFSDERGSQIESIRGEFAARAAATLPGSVERRQIEREGISALGAEGLAYGRETYFAGRQLNVSGAQLRARQLADDNRGFSARFAEIDAQRESARVTLQRETVGLNRADPQQEIRFQQATARFAQTMEGLASDTARAGRDFTLAASAIATNTRATQARLSGNLLQASNLEAGERFRQALGQPGGRDLEPQLRENLRVDRLANQVAETQRNVGLDTQFQSTVQRTGNNNLAARLTELRGGLYGELGVSGPTDPRYREVVQSDRGQRLLRNEQASEAQARVEDARQRAETGLGTRAIAQGTVRQRMLNDLNPLAAQQQNIVDETTNEILRTGIEMSGRENQVQRRQRIGALEEQGQARLGELDRRLRFGGRAETTTRFGIGGDPNNIAYLDVVRAREVTNRALGRTPGGRVDQGIENLRQLSGYADAGRVQKAEEYYARQHNMKLEDVRNIVKPGSGGAFGAAADEAESNPANKADKDGITQSQAQQMINWLQAIATGGALAG